jgi:hypothetical protein
MAGSYDNENVYLMAIPAPWEFVLVFTPVITENGSLKNVADVRMSATCTLTQSEIAIHLARIAHRMVKDGDVNGS